MTIPHLPAVRIALWEELEKAGGTGERQDIIEKLGQQFQLTQSERQQTDPIGSRTFDKRVDSAVAQSRKLGWMETWQESGRAIWKLTSVYFQDNPSLGQDNKEEELRKRFKALRDDIDKLEEFIRGAVPKEG